MQSRADITRRIFSLAGCGVAAGVMAGVGLGGAYLDYQLAAAARAYCDAAFEAGGRFELNFLLVTRLGLMPVVALVTGMLGLLLYLVLSLPKAMGRAGRVAGVVLGVAVALAGPIGLVLYDFAVTGTPAGYPGDSGLCGPDNVPPWWPSWLPS